VNDVWLLPEIRLRDAQTRVLIAQLPRRTITVGLAVDVGGGRSARAVVAPAEHGKDKEYRDKLQPKGRHSAFHLWDSLLEQQAACRF
jgi:hypothetical protein